MGDAEQRVRFAAWAGAPRRGPRTRGTAARVSLEGRPDLAAVQGLCGAPVVHHEFFRLPLLVEVKLTERVYLKDTGKIRKLKRNVSQRY